MTFPSWPNEPPERGPDRPSYPYPPLRPMPKREGPLMVPVVDLPGDRRAVSRRVLLTGPLDDEAATRAAAELMELDGRAGDDVELVVNSDGGPLAAVLPLLDVLGLMRARVHTLCVGRATGTAAVVLACGTGTRRAAAHAIISLRCTADHERLEGPPAALRGRLEELEIVRRHVVDALVAATHRERGELEAELDDGRMLDAAGAAALGLVDPAQR